MLRKELALGLHMKTMAQFPIATQTFALQEKAREELFLDLFITTTQAEKLQDATAHQQLLGSLQLKCHSRAKNARDEIMQNAEDGLVNCYYLVKKQDTESVLEEKYNTGAIALQISTLRSDTFYGLTLTTKKNGNDGVWAWDGLLPQLVSANQKAISVRRVIKNYSSLVSGGSSIENINIYPYIPGYEYGSQANPIIIRSADEFNRVFGQETGLVRTAYYAISQMYNKEIGIVFGSYRLVASIDFDSLTYVEND